MTSPPEDRPPRNALDSPAPDAVADQPPSDAAVGVVVRPPEMTWNGERYTGPTFIHRDLDPGTAARADAEPNSNPDPGFGSRARLIVIGNFVGIVAATTREVHAAVDQATWRWQRPSSRTRGAANPRPDVRADADENASAAAQDASGDHAGAMALSATYRWPMAEAVNTQACAVAWWHGDGMTVWSATDTPAPLRAELAALLEMPATAIRVVATGAAPSIDDVDVAADAALLSRAVAWPVRVIADVQDDGVQRSPAFGATAASGIATQAALGSATSASCDTVIGLSAVITDPHDAGQYSVAPSRYLGRRPSIARLLMGGAATLQDDNGIAARGDVAVLSPVYALGDARVHWPKNLALGTPEATGTQAYLPVVFAQESFIDEAAHRAGEDPLAFRLARLQDARGADLLARVALAAAWTPSAASTTFDADIRSSATRPSYATTSATDNTKSSADTADTVAATGRGIAYACAWDDTQYPPVRTWSAWVADVAVDPQDGRIAVTRVVVGHDAEQSRDDAGGADPDVDTAAIEMAVRATTHHLLEAPDAFDTWRTDAPPATDFLPTIDVVNNGGGVRADVATGRAATPPGAVDWHAHAALPAAAAVANAVFAATGVRLRDAPFGDARTQALLRGDTGSNVPTDRAQRTDRGSRRRAYTWMGGIAAAAAGLVVAALPWRAAIAPVAAPDLSLYSVAALERGRLVAAAGDCVVCHTVPGGAPNAGGLALDTPFGTVYTTNITPDPETGIGAWSFAAFDRAMRQGIHRDGRHLYPAFPYTSFAKLTEADMQSLYAYMMTQPPVVSRPPEAQLAFPFNLRGLMAGWNALFHRDAMYTPDPDRSALWNRGAYLVQGAGHCGACHTARNPLGAERTGAAFLGGGNADGWDAPALNGTSAAPLAWTEGDLFDYLRTGFSARHGVAAGPMAPVIHGLSQLPDSDIRAMAVYLASLSVQAQPPESVSATSTAAVSAAAAAAAEAASTSSSLTATATATAALAATGARVFDAQGEALFRGACAACHDDGATVYGAKPALALNSNVHSARPDNLIQVILQGIEHPANPALGYMPAFGDSFNDKQVAALVDYMRHRYAPGKPVWTDTQARVGALRAQHGE